jgi:hypothetical protein
MTAAEIADAEADLPPIPNEGSFVSSDVISLDIAHEGSVENLKRKPRE